MFHHTRIAPTPSGFLHLGNIFSFSVTAALAARTGARVALRIDDMDQQRLQPEYLQDIFDTLFFLGIGWQVGPASIQDFQAHHSQTTRLPLYKKYLQRLVDTGSVYACTCSRSDILQHSPTGVYPGTCKHKGLSLDTPGASWRLSTSASDQVTIKQWEDESFMLTLPADVQDSIVRKKDGMPAYQLCSLADDLYLGIDLVVRGWDLLHSTCIQLYMAQLLDEKAFTNTTFCHHPLLLSGKQEKLSKSAGDTSIQYLRQQGWPPSKIFQTIAQMAGLPKGVNTAMELGEAFLNA